MFFDRADAGRQLAHRLDQYQGSAVLYALSPGGVLVGYEIAKNQGLPMDVLINNRIDHPINRLMTICLVSEDGDLVCNDHGLCGVSNEWIKNAAVIKQQEARARRDIYNIVSQPKSVAGKVAILVDDGITTGLTMKAAILKIKKQAPLEIVIAAPVAIQAVVKELETKVHEVFVLRQERHHFRGVKNYYQHFPPINDMEVINCLKKNSQNL